MYESGNIIKKIKRQTALLFCLAVIIIFFIPFILLSGAFNKPYLFFKKSKTQFDADYVKYREAFDVMVEMCNDCKKLYGTEFII